MIVRILGEGQSELSEQEASVLGELDRTLIDAMETGDAASFHSALAASLDEVRRSGTAVAADHLWDIRPGPVPCRRLDGRGPRPPR